MKYFYIHPNQKRDLLDTTFLNVRDKVFLAENNLSFFCLLNVTFNLNSSSGFLFDDIILEEFVENKIKEGKCILVLNVSEECTSSLDDFFVAFISYVINKYSLSHKNLKVLTGNLNSNLINKNINCEFIPYWFFLNTSAFFNRYRDVNQIEDFLNRNRSINTFNKKIICYNRVPRPQRKYLFYRIFNNPLLKVNINISLKNDFKYSDYQREFGISKDESALINEFFYSNGPWTVDDTDLDNDNAVLEINLNSIKSSFLYLVTESNVNRDVIFLTEKTTKALYACQPFIIHGNAYSLKTLQELGFKTFSKWWDESYDEEIDLVKRTNKILTVLEDISKKSDKELSSMLMEMEDTLRHNNSLFTESRVPSFVDKLEFERPKKLL